MTRFAGAEKILNRIQDLENARVEGSVPYLTPFMSSQNPPSNRSAKGSYFDYVEDKRKELDDIVNSDGGPWKKPDEPVDEVVPVDPADPVDPVEEIDPEKKAAQDKWRKIMANHIEEGKSKGRSEIDSMDQAVSLSRVMTPEENKEYNWAFEGVSSSPKWRKWGGGSKKRNSGSVSMSFSSGSDSGPTGSTMGSTRSSTGG